MPACFELPHDLENLLDQHGGKAHRGLIEQQEPRLRHQGAADCEHLLLATREHAGTDVAVRGQHRKQLIDGRELGIEPRASPRPRAELEVIFHRKRREDLPALRHLRDAERNACMGGQILQLPIFEPDPPGRDRLHAADRPYQRSLAGAVGAEEGDDLAGRDIDRNAVQRLDPAVAAPDVLNREHGRSPARHERRDRPQPRPDRRVPPRPCLRQACGRWQGRGCDPRHSSPIACRARPARR